MQNNLVNRETTEVTVELVKRHLCPNATDSELFLFVELCKKRNLNPWIKEAHLIKYGTMDATIVVAYEVFLKRANLQCDYKGYTAGLILKIGDKIERREGAFYQSGEAIVGGWCVVSREGKNDIRVEVPFLEYVGKKKDGSINKQWATKPGTMMIKVPISQAHRLAYPNEMGEMYSEDEMHGVGSMGNDSSVMRNTTNNKTVLLVTDEQASEMKEKATNLGKSEKVLAALGVDSFEAVPADKYEWTVTNLDKQLNHTHSPDARETQATHE